MRITPIAAAALAAAALTAGCDDDPPETGPEAGGVRSGEAASGGSGGVETDTEKVEDLGENPDAEAVSRDAEATPGDAGPNRREDVDRADRVGDGLDEDARTGSAEMADDDPNGMTLESDPEAADAPQDRDMAEERPERN